MERLEKTSYAVIGATGGIGRALVFRLIADGARVVLGGRDEARLQSLARETGSDYVCVDARHFDAVASFLREASAEGDLYGVVNCAGALLLKPAHLTTESEWNDVVAQNLTAAFATVHAGARALMKSGGAIALVSSAAASLGLVNHDAVAASKAGVEGLVRAAASTYASKGIRINGVAPGLVETPMSERITGNETARRISESMHPLGRIGSPEDVASALYWLVHPQQAWVTGQVVGVDGGLSRVRSKAGA